MKKIFIMLFSVLIAVTVFAQNAKSTGLTDNN